MNELKLVKPTKNIEDYIFERFKITDTKDSYDKLYDIVDLLTKIIFGKNDFSLN